jgi:hypothetical protein
MPSIDAVIFVKWVKDGRGVNVPDAISDIYAWAMANDEFLPVGMSGGGPFGKYEDLTGQANINKRILDNLGVFAARLEITVATAAHFANDARIWTLGYKRFDDDGEQTFSNWNTALSNAERNKAINFITNNSDITVQQLSNKFNASDTRLEIANKLKELFRE